MTATTVPGEPKRATVWTLPDCQVCGFAVDELAAAGWDVTVLDLAAEPRDDVRTQAAAQGGAAPVIELMSGSDQPTMIRYDALLRGEA